MSGWHQLIYDIIVFWHTLRMGKISTLQIFQKFSEFQLKPSILLAGQGVVVSVSCQASISRHFGRHRWDTGFHRQPFGGIYGQLGGYFLNYKWWVLRLIIWIFASLRQGTRQASPVLCIGLASKFGDAVNGPQHLPYCTFGCKSLLVFSFKEVSWVDDYPTRRSSKVNYRGCTS